ncbi:hypothetical protein LCGC14_0871960 [marine sediment metagenome]|uniref:Uncharacterized protein n=1 Tax=marine sediment metagenome TaxID=412755 RepID=A0A0F9P4E6_9ZZZZ
MKAHEPKIVGSTPTASMNSLGRWSNEKTIIVYILVKQERNYQKNIEY